MTSDYCWFEIEDHGMWHAWTRSAAEEIDDLAYAPGAPAVCSKWGGHALRVVQHSWNCNLIPPEKRCAACFAIVAPALAAITIGNVGPALSPTDPTGFVAYHSEVAILTEKVAELETALVLTRNSRETNRKKRLAAEHERDAYRAMVADLLASAHPNRRDHPAMSKQWERAETLLRDGPPPLAEEDPS
jgi:hypothetical protein